MTSFGVYGTLAQMRGRCQLASTAANQLSVVK